MLDEFSIETLQQFPQIPDLMPKGMVLVTRLWDYLGIESKNFDRFQRQVGIIDDSDRIIVNEIGHNLMYLVDANMHYRELSSALLRVLQRLTGENASHIEISDKIKTYDHTTSVPYIQYGDNLIIAEIRDQNRGLQDHFLGWGGIGYVDNPYLDFVLTMIKPISDGNKLMKRISVSTRSLLYGYRYAYFSDPRYGIQCTVEDLDFFFDLSFLKNVVNID